MRAMAGGDTRGGGFGGGGDFFLKTLLAYVAAKAKLFKAYNPCHTNIPGPP